MRGRVARIWATRRKPLSLGITRSVMTRSTWQLSSNEERLDSVCCFDDFLTLPPQRLSKRIARYGFVFD
jgi:hypothetical protein